jgi:hypothetical protein
MASRVLRPVLQVEKLLQQYRYKQPLTHIMASKVLHPVLKSELLQRYRHKQLLTHIMASRVLRPVLKSGEALTAVQVQTTTNTHYVK